MTDPIRWDDPASLELFNRVTGETAPVEPDTGYWPHGDGDYRVADELPCGEIGWFRPNGQPCAGFSDRWFIRNKTPQPCCDAAKELAELREAVLKVMADDGWSKFGRSILEREFSRFIQPEPVEVDPLVMLAREMTVADGVIRTKSQQDAIREGRAAQEAVAEHERRLREALAKRGLTITEGEAK